MKIPISKSNWVGKQASEPTSGAGLTPTDRGRRATVGRLNPSHPLKHDIASANGRRLLLACSIVCFSLACTSSVPAQDLKAERVFGWDFQRGDDRNLDLEPDGWRRRHDRQHPIYIKPRIVSRDDDKARRGSQEQVVVAKLMHAIDVGYWEANYVPEAIPQSLEWIMDRYIFENCLEIQMDGGAAEMVSPPFAIDSRFGYYLQAEMATEGLDGHQAWLELQLLDEAERPIEILTTPAVSHSTAWQTLLSPVGTTTDNSLRWGRVHAKVEPNEQLLVNGKARFDSIEIFRLPRLTLSTDLQYHIAQPGANFDVICRAMGIPAASSSVRFELRNHLGDILAAESLPLSDLPQAEPAAAQPNQKLQDRPLSSPHFVSTESGTAGVKNAPPSAAANGSVENTAEPSGGTQGFYDGVALWQLQLDKPGLYYVSVLLGFGVDAQRRELMIGVMPPSGAIAAGPFGWSIREFNDQLTPEKLPSLVARFGAGWVKYPVWFDQNDTPFADSVVTLTERLQSQGVRCVGKLDQPPASQRSIFGEGTDELPSIAVFRDPRAWEPVLDPVLTRMGLKIDWFQLGGDNDRSFQNQAKLTELLADVRSRMQTYSQELKLALCWNWEVPQLADSAKPWNAVQYSSDPQLTAAELNSYARSIVDLRTSGWVHLNPLPAARYRLLDRIRDLTERMIVVKQNDLAAAFLIDPFDPVHGILQSDLTLAEMLIPWTTLVTAIGDKQYAGSFAMPGGSTNHCFVSDQDAVMLVWNDRVGVEQLFVGSDLEGTDVWGAPIGIETAGTADGRSEQRIPVGPWPSIVRGIDPHILKWRQQFEVAVSNLSSTIGERNQLPLSLVNTLPQAASGSLSMISESLLGSNQATSPLQIAGGARTTISLPIEPRPDASAGKHDLRFDVNVNAGKPYQFSVYRSITLGTGDIEFRWELNRKSDQEIELRIELVNNTTQDTSFDCRFFPVGNPYQRFQITGAKPGTTLRDVNIRVTPADVAEGAWIRCEEFGTGRVLNYRLQL